MAAVSGELHRRGKPNPSDHAMYIFAARTRRGPLNGLACRRTAALSASAITRCRPVRRHSVRSSAGWVNRTGRARSLSHSHGKVTMAGGDEARRITANAFANGLCAGCYPVAAESGGHDGPLRAAVTERRASPVRAVGPFRRVLVGFDSSPDAADAVRAAVAIAVRDGGHVVALSVVRRVTRADGDADGESGSDGEAIRQLAETLFAELRRDLPTGSSVRLSVQVVSTDDDNPAQVVTEYATEHGFDVLVLGRHGDGRHGLGGRGRPRLGQVADRAVQACSVPVLLLEAR